MPESKRRIISILCYIYFQLLRWKRGNVNLRCLWQRAVLPIIMVTIEKRRLSLMLNENIKTIRKSKGLSQQELAVKLNVVRQTVSKWEQGGSLR